MPRKRPEPAPGRNGLLISAIGLAADLVTLGVFGYSLINSDSVTNPVSAILWIGILSAIPLTYFWGYAAYFTHQKHGKPAVSTLVVGLCLVPLYTLWGGVVLAEAFRIDTNVNLNGVELYEVPLESRLSGVIGAIILQLLLGLAIYLIVRLWSSLASGSGLAPRH
jgi:hypothetical protein